MRNKHYYIEVYYSTGDSNGYEDITSSIGISWDNLDIVKENLSRLKKHHEWYLQKNSVYYLNQGKKNIKKPKFVDPQFDQCFNMITDDKENFRVSASWCGHFEHLYSAIIKEHEDPEMVYRP